MLKLAIHFYCIPPWQWVTTQSVYQCFNTIFKINKSPPKKRNTHPLFSSSLSFSAFYSPGLVLSSNLLFICAVSFLASELFFCSLTFHSTFFHSVAPYIIFPDVVRNVFPQLTRIAPQQKRLIGCATWWRTEPRCHFVETNVRRIVWLKGVCFAKVPYIIYPVPFVRRTRAEYGGGERWVPSPFSTIHAA